MALPSPSPAAARRFDVCIRGAGVVGQTLALLLARERLKVALVSAPRPAAAVTDVRAYALNGTARALLQSLRAWPEADEATDAVPGVTPVTRCGPVVAQPSTTSASAAKPSLSSLLILSFLSAPGPAPGYLSTTAFRLAVPVAVASR